jgi:NADH-quinone oxidoreductase subunit B
MRAKYLDAPHQAGRDDLMVTRLDALVNALRRDTVNWSRRNSLWPYPFATACCGIELMATGASRYDIARFGAEVMRFSPRQSDLMIVAGRVPIKLMPVLQKIYMQMTEPKWVISMGACASSGGVFDTYAVVQGIDQFIPVDVYVPGCPPRPETLIEGVMAIQRLIDTGEVKDSITRGGGMKLVVQPTVHTEPVKLTVSASARSDEHR